MTIPPNVKYQELFLKLQREARENNRGLWTKESEEVEKKEDYYVASKNSKVFHMPDCKWAKKIKESNLIKFGTREESIDNGRRTCSECRP